MLSLNSFEAEIEDSCESLSTLIHQTVHIILIFPPTTGVSVNIPTSDPPYFFCVT